MKQMYICFKEILFFSCRHNHNRTNKQALPESQKITKVKQIHSNKNKQNLK